MTKKDLRERKYEKETKWSKRRRTNLHDMIITVIFFIAVELALLFILGHAVVHTDRYVTLEDTITFELENPQIKIANHRRGGDKVYVYSADGNEEYTYLFPMSNYMDQSGEQRIRVTKVRELLIAEDRLTVTVKKGTDSIVALSGEAHDYVTLHSYNSYEKTQIIAIGILYGVLQLIWLLGFVVYISWALDIRIWENIDNAYLEWRKKHRVPKKLRTQKTKKKRKKHRLRKEHERLIAIAIFIGIVIATIVLGALRNAGKLPVG